MARVSATVSARSMPRRHTAMAKAPIWASPMAPEVRPAMKASISAAFNSPPSRFLRMIS